MNKAREYKLKEYSSTSSNIFGYTPTPGPKPLPGEIIKTKV